MSRYQSPGRVISLVIFLGLFLLGSTVGVVSSAPAVAVDDVSVASDSVVETEANGPHIAAWKGLGVNSTVSGETGEYYVCLSIGTELQKQSISCKTIHHSGATESIQFTEQSLPTNVSESETLRIELYANGSSATPIDTATQQVTVLKKGSDPDDDGIITGDELSNDADPMREDTDSDGLDDGSEIREYKSNPAKKDTDGDGLSDGVEVEEPFSDPTKNDTDGDGLNDTVEINKHQTHPNKVDTDDDNLTDFAELNDHETNPTHADTDGDGLADDREIRIGSNPKESDSDNDGLADGAEMDHNTNPTKPDTDGDGLKDGVEVHKHNTDPTEEDTDGDGVDDLTELERGTDPNPQPFYLFAPLENPVKTAGTALAVLVIGVGGFVYRRRSTEGSTPVEPAPEHPTASPSVPIDQQPAEPLTDADHIQQLLGTNDGRMHQSEIVESTGWSKSKVSRLLSRMEDNDEISKISVGRENLITRPGDEPKHAGSTFEE